MSESASRPPQKRQLWLVGAEAPTQQQPVADVVIMRHTHQTYTYGIPELLLPEVAPGKWVTVPFGKAAQPLPAICLRTATAQWQHTRKPIQRVSAAAPLLTSALIDLGLWIADYYAAPLNTVFTALAPERTRQPLAQAETLVAANTAADDLTPKQQRLFDTLKAGPLPRATALERAAVTAAVLKPLEARGLVRRETATDEAALLATAAIDPTAAPPPAPEDDFALTADQDAARAAITTAAVTDRGFKPFLLFGVPGSGKTEVYVRTIRAVVAAGRQAILIVPEIALATQIVERLARRFGRVAVLHSQLTALQRAATLHAIAAGHVDVVIGTRSAVFAPCRNLGLLIVDEEQEGSLKSPAQPYFHARDVAVKRAQLEAVPVVLGSATPALETWYNAQHRGLYERLTLATRVPGAELPQTEIVSVEGEGRAAAGLLSRELDAALAQTLERGKQAIILHNRRGYALNLRCTRCGTVVTCPRCDGYLVVHQSRGPATLRCHRCGLRRDDVPTHCPDSSCHGPLERVGRAIQQLQERLQQGFHDARLQRLDSDAMRQRSDYVETLGRFGAGAADVLIGTQMVAKGLDFPNVELVGVIDGDAALWLPDFRAAERVFQLLIQVIGRAGRRAGAARAIIQVADPHTPAVTAARRLDYTTFAEQELSHRRRLFYPPVARLTRCILADRSQRKVREAAAGLAQQLRTLATRVHARIVVDDAEPCVQERLRERYRWQVLIRTPRDDSMQNLLRAAAAERLLRPKVSRFTIDVDAIDML